MINLLRVWHACQALILAFATLLAITAAVHSQLPLPDSSGLKGGPRQATVTADGDPLPLRRVFIAPNQLAEQMERVRQGILIQMPRAEFETRLADLKSRSLAIKDKPRLQGARYRAALVETALVGNAEWIVGNDGSAPAVMPMPSLNLAVRTLRSGDRMGVLGDLHGQGLGLLVDKAGRQTFTLEWSARGEESPKGLRFDLRFPACIPTTFEIELPADRSLLVAHENGVVRGPLTSAKPNHRHWILECAGKSQLDLLVLPNPGPGQATVLMLSQVHATQELAVDGIDADYEFQIEVHHARIQELVFECDPAVRPVDVSCRNLEVAAWDFAPGKLPSDPGRLSVRLREPKSGSLPPLRIRCRAEFANEEPRQTHSATTGTEGMPVRSTGRPERVRWSCPWLQLINGITRGETLELRLSPEIQLEGWEAGSFRPIRAATDARGIHVLAFTNARPPTAAVTQRPHARVRTQGADWRTREALWWQVGAGTESLTAQVDYDVGQGKLLQLPLRFPPAWSVDQVELAPADLLRSWSIDPAGRQRPRLLVDLNRALLPGMNARLTATLRKERADPAQRGTQDLPVPEVMSEPGRAYSGLLGIRLPAQAPVSLQGALVGSANAGSDAFSIGPIPWGPLKPDHVFVYSGRPPLGSVRLGPQSAGVRAVSSTDVLFNSGEPVVLVRLTLTPEHEAPATVDLYISSSVGRYLNWRVAAGTNRLLRFERSVAREVGSSLRVLGSDSPLTLLNTVMGNPRGESWRLVFERPLIEAVTLEATVDLASESRARDTASRLVTLGASHPLSAAAAAATVSDRRAAMASRWEVPLVGVLCANGTEGEIHLREAGLDRVRTEAVGLRERSVPGNGPAWRSFQYQRPPFGLVLSSHGQDQLPAPPARVESGHLLAWLQSDRRVVNLYRFTIKNWSQPSVAVQLPGKARVLAVLADGSWLTLTGSSDRKPESTEIAVPVLGGSQAHDIEILYETEGPRSWGFAPFASPAPTLPLQPASFLRTWILPEHLTPVWSESLHRLPVGSAAGEHALAWSWLVNDVRHTTTNRARAGVAVVNEFCGGWPERHADSESSLGTFFGEASSELRRIGCALIVDNETLARLGLTPSSPLPDGGAGEARATRATQRDPFDRLGIDWIACGDSVLVTSLGRTDPRRPDPGGQGAGPPGDIVAAVAEAARLGRDCSGRFRHISDWLDTGSTQGTPNHGFLLGREHSTAPWCTWEAVAGEASKDRLLVLDRRIPRGLGLLLGVVLALLVRKTLVLSIRARLGLLLSWLLVTGLAWLWLPSSVSPVAGWPAVLGLLVGLLWYLSTSISTTLPSLARPPKLTEAARTSALPLLWLTTLLGVVSPLTGQAPATVVWIVPGPPEAPDAERILFPPSLLTQLHALEARVSSMPRQSALFAAEYTGTMGATSVEFLVDYSVYCPREDLDHLLLPLSGVELLDATLDGQVAHLSALPAPQSGYSVRVQGQGIHRLQVRFTARLTADREEAEVRFGIPELVRCEMRLTAPGADSLVAAAARGAQQTVTTESDSRLHADLGRSATAVLRWRQRDRALTTPIIRLQEAHFWDLKPGTSRLLSVLQYRLERGEFRHVELDLPSGLEVRRLEATALRSGGSSPRLRAWTVGPGSHSRRLRIEFLGRVTEGVQILAEFVPVEAWKSASGLPLPAPVATIAEEGLLAYRAEGLEASVSATLRLAGRTPEAFERTWREFEVENPGAPQRAYTFRRTAAGPPVLGLELGPRPLRARCNQQVTWQLGSAQLDFRAEVRLHAPDEELMLAEAELPRAAILTSVKGSSVRCWHRAGNRLQVWFARNLSEVALELQGWMPRGADKPPPAGADTLELTGIRWLAAGAVATRLRVIAPPELVVTPISLQNLTPAGVTSAPSRELSFTSEQASHGGTFAIQPRTATQEGILLSHIEITGSTLVYSAHLEGPYYSPFKLRITPWTGPDPVIETSMRVRSLGPVGEGVAREWEVSRPLGATQGATLRLTGTLAFGSTPLIRIPVVTVETAAPLERWVVLAGQDFREEDSSGLVLTKEASHLQARFPALAASSLIWRAREPNWRLILRRLEGATDPSLATAWWLESEAAILDSRTWSHRCTFWLGGALDKGRTVRLPPGARLERVLVDGRDMPLPPESTVQFELPVAEGPPFQTVELSWRYEHRQEALARPRIEVPTLEGMTPAAMACAVRVPHGYILQPDPGGAAPISLTGLHLRRASALLHASQGLAERRPRTASVLAALRKVQRQFYQCCFLAECSLELAEKAAAAEAFGESPAAWLARLREQNLKLAQRCDFLKARARAEREVRAGITRNDLTAGSATAEDSHSGSLTFASDRGIPQYFEGRAGKPPPQLHLIPAGLRSHQALALASSGWCLAALAIWIGAGSTRWTAITQHLWPEALAGLALLCWILRVNSYLAMAPLAVGVAARVLYLGVWAILAYERRRLVSPAGLGSGRQG